MTMFTKVFKPFLLIVIAISLAAPVSLAQASDRPFLSSLLTLMLYPTNLKENDQKITIYPNRSAIHDLKKHNYLLYTVNIQPNPTAPLIFICPGLGGASIGGTPQFMAEIAYNAGYSVVTMPSTTHWTFAVAASSNGKIGYLPNDAKDLYKAIRLIKMQLESSAYIRPTKYGLLGYSYGGLDVSFLAAEDVQQKAFNFSFVIALNPPLLREAALAKIDKYFSLADNASEEKKFQLRSYAMGKMIDFASIKPRDRVPPSLEALASQFTLSETSIAWLIADTFRTSLKQSAQIGYILAGQNVSLDNAITGSLSDYLHNNIYSGIASNTGLSYETISQNSEISTAFSKFTNNFTNNKNIVLFHSTDDFISFPQANFVLNALKVEKHIYNFGGHLGMFADTRVQNDLTRTLLSLKNK